MIVQAHACSSRLLGYIYITVHVHIHAASHGSNVCVDGFCTSHVHVVGPDRFSSYSVLRKTLYPNTSQVY